MFVLVLFLTNCEHSNDRTETVKEREASFPGGAPEMRKFIQARVNYPQEAIENLEQGRVYVAFIVEKNGTISNVEVLNGGVTPALNKEAKRLVAIMPKWIPSVERGMAVRARCRLPITFDLGYDRPQKSRKKLKRKPTK